MYDDMYSNILLYTTRFNSTINICTYTSCYRNQKGKHEVISVIILPGENNLVITARTRTPLSTGDRPFLLAKTGLLLRLRSDGIKRRY